MKVAVCTRKLHLSTNNIERIANLSSMTQLELLSLGRNLIKKVEGFDGLGQCLKELWISYNLLEKLVPLPRPCQAVTPAATAMLGPHLHEGAGKYSTDTAQNMLLHA